MTRERWTYRVHKNAAGRPLDASIVTESGGYIAGVQWHENAPILAAAPAMADALERIAALVTAEQIEAADDYDDTEGAESYGLLVGMMEAATIAREAIAGLPEDSLLSLRKMPTERPDLVAALKTIAAIPLEGDELPDGGEYAYEGNDDEIDAYRAAIEQAREALKGLNLQ